jgi:two-component system, LytTR family, sensor kinase
MDRPPLLQQPWLRWLAVFGFWTLLALFDTSQNYLLLHFFVRHPQPMPLKEILILNLFHWYMWGATVPLLAWLARCFPVTPPRWHRSLTPLIVISVLCSLFRVILDIPVEILVRTDWGYLVVRPGWDLTSMCDLFLIFFTARFLIYLMICWAILGVSQALDYYRMYRDRALKASQLQARLMQAQLQVLKMQLHPHFLFNTLHTISALMHQDVHLADRMVARLAELLRITLENAKTQEVPLRQEIDFLKPYIEIQQARLGQRLAVDLDVPADVLGALVPNLILQPLIENAIQHGIAPRAEGGRIEVRARRLDQALELQVCDTGPGLPGTNGYQEGVGLANTRARLRQLYGEEQHFRLSNRSQGGLMVQLTIPFHEEDEGEARIEERGARSE